MREIGTVGGTDGGTAGGRGKGVKEGGQRPKPHAHFYP